MKVYMDNKDNCQITKRAHITFQDTNCDSNFKNTDTKAAHDIKSSIAIIEICLYALTQDTVSDELKIMKSALQRMREFSDIILESVNQR